MTAESHSVSEYIVSIGEQEVYRGTLIEGGRESIAPME